MFSAAHRLPVGGKTESGGEACFTVTVFFLLQAFEHGVAAFPTPRSGNPGYLIGKPLLALTGDFGHSVSFGELGRLSQPDKTCC